MDHMLPSPGFSIPSIGTPLHQPEEDQQILPMAQQQQQSQSQQQQQPLQIPPLLPIPMTAQKNINNTYAPSLGFTTPQSMMHPQTPVSRFFGKISFIVCFINNCKSLIHKYNLTFFEGRVKYK